MIPIVLTILIINIYLTKVSLFKIKCITQLLENVTPFTLMISTLNKVTEKFNTKPSQCNYNITLFNPTG